METRKDIYAAAPPTVRGVFIPSVFLRVVGWWWVDVRGIRTGSLHTTGSGRKEKMN